jgi:ribosomal protein S18 acetylase RimI-like enzyme
VTRKTSISRTRSLVVNRQDGPSKSVSGQVQAIYTEAFPPGQRVDFNTLASAVTEGKRTLFTVQDDGQVLGFAITASLPDTDIHCLEYLAVRRGERSRGIGSRLIRAALSDLQTRAQASGLILEVEAEQEGTGREQETRRARVAFYRRNGADLVEEVARFLAPDLTDGGTIEMKLMWLPAASAPIRLSGPQLAACILGIYSQCYGLPLDDPLVEAALRISGRPVLSP